MPKKLDRYMQAEDGCWLWEGPLRGGYGQVWYEGKKQQAHRAVYEHLVGPIPDGLDLDHLCRQRSCVNPAHMEPVTRAENLRRGNSGKWDRGSTCKRDHPLEGENLYVTPDGRRQCRACQRERARKREQTLHNNPPSGNA